MSLYNPLYLHGDVLAEVFTWGRKVGRLDCKVANLELNELPREMKVTNHQTGVTVTFTFNRILIVPTSRLQYAEWLSIDGHKPLKIHVTTIGWKKPIL